MLLSACKCCELTATVLVWGS